MFVSATCLNY